MRIILADDQQEVRSALKILLEQEPGINVVGEAAELTGLLIQTKETQPDVVLVDWELSQIKVADMIPLLRMFCPGLKVVALSGRPEAAKSAMSAGVDAFVSKGEHPEKLLDTIREFT